MSFADDVREELLQLPLKKNCCRKAFLCGLMYGATVDDSKTIHASFHSHKAAELSSELLQKQFSVSVPVVSSTVCAREYFTLHFTSKSLLSFFAATRHGEMIDTAATFRCADCSSAFLRGTIISSSTVSDPHKGYHMEFSLPANDEERLNALYAFLHRCGLAPKKATRQGKGALYFKSSTAISDILYLAGAVRSGFDIANVNIERDIRNNENRATNCVASNISKSVSASQTQIAAIRKIEEAHRLQSLSEELYETARLRLENEEATLSELASLHRPPISKSGLNHRLQKIMALADELTVSE